MIADQQLTLSPIERSTLERCESRIEAGFDQIGTALLEIRDKRLYREYGTWQQYCDERWKKTARRIDQLIAGAALAATLTAAGLPAPSSEYQIRSLTGQESERAVRTWENATKVYGDSPTHQQVVSTQERLGGDETPPDPDAATKRMVEAAGYAHVTNLMQTGMLKPKLALALCDTLDGCETRVQSDVQALDIQDTTFIREMNRLYKRRQDSYDEMVRSRCLQFENHMIPVHRATSKDLRRWLDWKYSQHRQIAFGDKIIRERQVCEVVAVEYGIVSLKIAGIQHDLQVGDRVQVSLVRVSDPRISPGA